jgi:hypothetical protein
MTLVRFATLCDQCGTRSREYTAWPTCAGCHADICSACLSPGSLVETDGEQPERCLCVPCALVEEIES